MEGSAWRRLPPLEGIHAVAALALAKLRLDGFGRTDWLKGCLVFRGSSQAVLNELNTNGNPPMTCAGISKGSACDGVSVNSESPCREEYESGKANSKLAESLLARARRGSRRMIAPPTPHDTGSPARSLLRG